MIQHISFFNIENNNIEFVTGHIVPEQWIFGGYDPIDIQGFLIPVP